MADQKRQVVLFALSTCIWCRKTRNWLEQKGVEFKLHHMDLLTGAEKQAALDEMNRHVERIAYPVVVIDGSTVIQGYHPDMLEEELG